MSVTLKFRALWYQTQWERKGRTKNPREKMMMIPSLSLQHRGSSIIPFATFPLEGCVSFVVSFLSNSYTLCESLNWRTFKDPFEPEAFIYHGLLIPETEDEEGAEIVAVSPAPRKEEELSDNPEGCYSATYHANEPNEDRFVLSKMKTGEVCAGVFDGHGGWQAAEYAQNRLVACLMLELGNMNTKADPSYQIEQALKRAFGRVEREFIYLIKQAFEAGVGAVSRIGSCALLAYIDCGRVFVANAGDCRAVVGKRKGDGWESVALSSDHNVREPNEQLKLRRWHPAEENVFVCKRPGVCYVKGCLQPTRSFGDAYLKYPEFNGPPYNRSSGMTDRSRGRHIPPPYTPPYITAQPEVVTYDLGHEDEFLILGTDGLWDFLSNEEAVEIVVRGLEAGEKDLGKWLLNETLKKIADSNKHSSIEALQQIPAGRSRRKVHDDTTIVVLNLKELYPKP
mmetsp:Transcript_30053/g.39546  ORF Transcript_30053/g.39546 Transcript_30053/m.39546 type:complete len:453 (-) Transcript_30053:509-1867(-)|eukprot:CAMPEP_0117752326 /NCGR_PEP_ID=MMETSP0947-20121206/11538_1 /TAXON_ID=44440 /ORGANISM="Chattonella subsalsa, Strain CCMP2191" /LENGTH=452 /DNA_ID=CAMNT_0005570945 /DNA_START=377 /DNA_END=1735 /DNA_ORIENTATION=+